MQLNTLRVPDKTRLRVHYTYQLTELGKNHQGDIEISNKVTVTGQENLSYEVNETFGASEILFFQGSEASTIAINKVDQNTRKPLDQARFVLFVPNPGDDNGQNVQDAINAAESVGITDIPYDNLRNPLHPIELEITSSGGKAKMTWQHIKADAATIYALLETYAPPGYQRLETPIFLKINQDETLNILNQQELAESQVTLSADGKSLIISNPSVPPGTGDLSVTKSVTGAAGDKTKDWHFRVELSDKSINGTYGGMTFTNGVAEFTLKDGENKTARGLPVGVAYTVTEAEANLDYYTTTSEGASGTIPQTGFAHADFTNSREDPGLTVEKRVVNPTPEDLEREWHFTVTLTPAAGRSIDAGEITWIHSGGGSADVRQDGDGAVLTFVLKHEEYITFGNVPVGTRYHVAETEANQSPWQTWVDPSLSPADGTVTFEEIWVRFLNERTVPTETETPAETPPETEPHTSPEPPAETPHETESLTVHETFPETWSGTAPETPRETEAVTVPVFPEKSESESESVPQAPEKPPEDGGPPDTGDSRHPAFWLAVMALSMAAMWLTAWQVGKAARREKVPGRSRKRRRRW